MKIEEIEKPTSELRREVKQYLEDRLDEVFTFSELQEIFEGGRPRHVLAYIVRELHRYEVSSNNYLYGSKIAIESLKEHLRGGST